MSIPSSVPRAPEETPADGSGIPAIATAVHAAVAGVAPQDVSPEILATAIADLFQNNDVVWSTDKSSALATGKANFLRITSNGDILLDVIKPWVRFSTGVHLDVGVDLEAIKATLRDYNDWSKGSPEGFLPSWVTSYIEWLGRKIAFDPDGSSRPGAIYVFNRIRTLRESAAGAPGLMLQWIGRHTNPAEGETTFKVEDELKIVKY